jgi:hypothetical protein
MRMQELKFDIGDEFYDLITSLSHRFVGIPNIHKPHHWLNQLRTAQQLFFVAVDINVFFYFVVVI